MSFSESEIESKVSDILVTTTRRRYGTLGERLAQDNFEDLTEIAAGVFLNNPTAPYYVVGLAVKRAIEGLSQLRVTLEELGNQVGAAGRRVQVQDPGTELENARAALIEIERASGSRDQALKGVRSLPAYIRFQDQLQKFLDGPGVALKQDGQITQTPAEARVSIAQTRKDAEEALGELVRRLNLIMGAMEELSGLKLPSVTSKALLGRAREQLDSLRGFGGKTKLEQEQTLRETTLAVLAQKALVKSLAGFQAPTRYLELSGSLTGYCDESHPATPARLEAVSPGPYSIEATTKDKLVITLDGGTPTTVTLAPSLVAEIQSMNPGPYTFGVMDYLMLRVTVAGVDQDFSITLAASTTADVVGELNAGFTTAGFPVTASVVSEGGIGYVSLRYTGAGAAQDRATLLIVDDASNTAPAVLGFIKGSLVESAPTRASLVAADLATKVPGGLFSAGFDEVASLKARSVPGDPLAVQVYRRTGTGDVSSPGANQILLTFTAGSDLATLDSGDKLTLRDGPNAGTTWNVIAVTPTSIQGTGAVTPTSASNVLADTGPLSALSVGGIIEITGGTNRGSYEVASEAPNGAGFGLVNLLPQTADSTTGQAISGMECRIGYEYLVIESRDTTSTSRVQVSSAPGNTGASLFFPGSADERPVTKWLQANFDLTNLRVGDLVEVFTTSYQDPSTTYRITSLEGRILGLDSTLSLTSSLNVSSGPNLPFVRLGSGRFGSFQTLKEALSETLAGLPPQYWLELDRRLNSILTGSFSNGAASFAQAHLQTLLAVLGSEGSSDPTTLEYALTQYQHEIVPVVDTLLDTLRQKGADRARDLLLECRFNEFFSLTMDTSSYSGFLQAALREVAREDMPIRKEARRDRVEQRVLATQLDEDYEYDRSDIEDVGVVDSFDDVERSLG